LVTRLAYLCQKKLPKLMPKPYQTKPYTLSTMSLYRVTDGWHSAQMLALGSLQVSCSVG
jgi:hypothetical protein